MANWMCTNCGYYFDGNSPPERCPSCKEICVFNNVSSYLPNTSEGQIDPRIASSSIKDAAPTQPGEKVRSAPILEAVSPTYIFGTLTEAQRQRIEKLEQTEVYEAKSIIFPQDTKASKLYLLEEGQVSLSFKTNKEESKTVAIIKVGGAFGWSALIRPHQFTATATALSRVRVRAIEGTALLKLMRDDPKIGLLIMQDIAEVMANRLKNLEASMSN